MQAYNEKIPVCNKAEDKKRYFKNVKTEFAGVHLAFGHFKTFYKKANIFVWNVLRSTMFQVFFRKIHQIQRRNGNQ